MARSLNRIELIGNLGADPELRNTPQGASVCTLKIATSEAYKDKNSGEWKENTEWHSVVLWEHLAENAARNLKKGSKVFIDGKIKTRSYEGKDGITRYITEVYANNLINLDPKSTTSSSSQFSKDESSSNTNNFKNNEEDEDDDIPF
ncbi:MAG TPA: single-stranded DNA-binding protein [Candidatus Kapabacteria bacterium]|nr:single-stranded DNA-binding protein [Candidatus Kapabacteria bacterium]